MPPASSSSPPVCVGELAAWLQELVVRWHDAEPQVDGCGLQDRIAALHRWNFLLWHEEDLARAPTAGDPAVAAVKRAIDRYNQSRHDSIEAVDDLLAEILAERHIAPPSGALAATETPASALDRLSVLELRRYHMLEEARRPSASGEHRARAATRLGVLDLQREQLVASLDALLGEIFHGLRPLHRFRQMKMYNDPTLNPQLYSALLPDQLASPPDHET
jgi:hypothetical protein